VGVAITVVALGLLAEVGPPAVRRRKAKEA
jgi:hypothetical protein